MKNLNLQKPEEQPLFEYLLLLSPTSVISEEINGFKALFNEHYGCSNATKSKPHLTLIHFLQVESAEFRIINCLDKFAKFVQPIPIELNGFGQFQSHTIFVKPVSPYAIIQLVKDMRTKFQRLLKHAVNIKPDFITAPHITISRSMTAAQFENAWAVWEKETYSASFVANEMTLLRRAVATADFKPLGKYKAIQHFSFGSRVRDTQLVLAL